MKICIVISNYYKNISKNLLLGAIKTLKKNKIYNYKIISVPGSFEIPFVIAKNIRRYDGFVALGCIIKGKTPHFDFISQSIINSISFLSITEKKPIGNGVITCLNKKQAAERSSLKQKNKGGEAAKALISIIKI